MSEYSDSVEGIAEDILNELEVKTQEDFENVENDVHDRVWENVDSSQWIIYYTKNLTVLEQSQNSDAIDDAGIDLDTSQGWRHILAQVAFFAMEADVKDAIKRQVEDLPETAEDLEETEEE